MQVGAVDSFRGGPEKGIAAEFGSLMNFPTIMIYGRDRLRSIDYKGDRDRLSIIRAAMGEVGKVVQQRSKETDERSGVGGGGSEMPPPPPEGSLGLDESKVVELDEL